MLEAADIDDDYFTPVPSTSLANIFIGPSTKETSNDTLKYTPPKKNVPLDNSIPQNVGTKAEEDTKVSECMFACALTAYEWINNDYSSRGKLGFAILKIAKDNSYSIVLYNANKTTLSNTPITTGLNMTLKGKNYISYYDGQNKYWSIYGESEEIIKIIDILETLGVNVKHMSSADKTLPELKNPDDIEKNSSALHEKESDTDSSVNRRTKASVLSRMANMGHSVLPSSSLIDKSTDSSDSNQTENQPPKIRPKPNKVTLKRANIDKKLLDPGVSAPDSIKMPLAKIELSTMQSSNPSLFAMVNGQLVPVSSTNVMQSYGGSCSSEINLFMTEQRMNNNEIRLNINRTTDKVDQVLEKLKFFDRSNVDKGNLQSEIMQKLLTEYENKIKNYEQILSNKKDEDDQCLPKKSVLESYEMKISNLQSIIEEKDKEIFKLKEEIQDNDLAEEMNKLKEDVALKTEMVKILSKELDQSREVNRTSSSEVNKSSSSEAFQEKVKKIMNEVYHSIVKNFENDVSYSGDNVTRVVASILKKSTLESINDNFDK